MNTIQAHIFEYDTSIHRRVFWVLAGILFLLALLYSYFINASVLSVVERNNYKQETSLVSAHISTLEQKYLSQAEGITVELAQDLGFSVGEDVAFIKRSALASRER